MMPRARQRQTWLFQELLHGQLSIVDFELRLIKSTVKSVRFDVEKE